MERHQRKERRGYEKKYAQSSILPDKELSRVEISPRSRLKSDDSNSPNPAFRPLAFSYSFEGTSPTQDDHLRAGRGFFESRNDNIHFSRVGNKGLTSSCGDIRLIKDDISPRSRLESDDNDFLLSALRLGALAYSFEDMSSTQDVHPRAERGLYRSRNDIIHPSRIESKGLASSCGDIRLIEDEISPRNPLKSEDNVYFHTGFQPVAFSYSFEDIPSTQDVHPRTGRGLYRSRNDNIRSSRVGTKWLASSCGDIRLIEDEISPRSSLKSGDNDTSYPVFRAKASSDSCREIPSAQDIHRRNAPGFHGSQNDNIHFSRLAARGVESSSEDILVEGSEFRPQISLRRSENSDFNRSPVEASALLNSDEDIHYAQGSRLKVKENEFFSNFLCSYLLNHDEGRSLVTLKVEDCFILCLKDLDRINSIYYDFKHENDGMFNKAIKNLFKKRSKKKKNRVGIILTQCQKEGSLELVSPKKKSDNNKNLEYKVKNDVLWHSLSTKYSVHQKPEDVIERNLGLSSESSSDANIDTREKTQFWEWKQKSMCHRNKFVQLREYGRDHPEDIKEVTGVRVCFLDQFCIGRGSDGTRVYVGLGKDGVEKAVKRMRKDACGSSANHEKLVLTKNKIIQSNNVINYWVLDEESDNEYLLLILELCEETLEDFVRRKNLNYLLAMAPEIIRHILKGLADLHRDPMPILHRDVKPSNILQNVDGKWLLADFGISRFMEKDASTFRTNQKGTKDWMAVEACQCDEEAGDNKVRCKKESDIQVTGMVAFYIVTKGGHPYGEERYRLDNLLKGVPVDMHKVEDLSTNDLITWMLSHDPKERPSAEEALKHPYLQSEEQKFELLCRLGNQVEIKTKDARSDVVRKLNSDPKDWRTLIKSCILKYLCNGQPFRYSSSWTDCLRLIRNVMEHWHDKPRPRPEAFYLVGDPRTYFLKLFPNLPVEAHRIVRQTEWRERLDLKKYFM